MQGSARIERAAALFGGALCVALAAVTWRKVGAWQGTWPFPALYFIELMLLGVLVAAAYLRHSDARAPVAWAAAGAVAAFCILGAMTVGLLFLPAEAGMIAAAVITDVRQQASLAVHAGIFVGAVLVQAAVMLAMAFIF